MRPNTSVRQPIIAGVRGRKLSDLLRTWHQQPRQNSSALFWSAIAFAFAVDMALLFIAFHLLGMVDPVKLSPPSDRRMHVLHARNAALWEPLRHWGMRLDGRLRNFESFCRDAVRILTGDEHFEGNDPLPVVVSWMLHDNLQGNLQPGCGWDDYPFLRCEGLELRAFLFHDGYNESQLSRNEQLHGIFVEPSVPRHSKRFHKLLRGIAAKVGSATAVRLSPLEKQAMELKNRLALFDRLRSGAVNGGEGDEMETASAALREAYQSGSSDLFAAAVADFLDASRRALPVKDEAAARRLACEDWLNERHPFQRALILSLMAAGFLAVASMMGSQRRLWRRGFLVSGLLACAACLSCSVTGFCCRAILHDGAPMSDGSEVILWIASAALCLGLVLALWCRDGFLALAGALVSSMGFVLAKVNGPSVPNGLAGDLGLTLHLLATVSAYAALALAWGLAALTLVRLVIAPPSTERLGELATKCVRAIGIGLALLMAAAILGACRGASHGWDGPVLGTFLALPGCALLLFARRVGWLQPFGVILGSAFGFALLVMVWHVFNRGAADRHAFDLAANAWLYGACLVNLSLMAHAALRYYFGKQHVAV